MLVNELIPYAHRSGITAKVPTMLLLQLIQCLKHYPTTYELSKTALECPSLWGEPYSKVLSADEDDV